MNRFLLNFTVTCIFCFLAKSPFCQSTAVSYDKYMRRHTLVWDSISTNYYTGIILGNGKLGTNIYQENEHQLRFDVGRTDVTDHRPHFADSIFAEQLVSQPRLPIGRILLQTKGTIIDAKMQLDIYNAEASGVIYTTAGSVTFNAIVPTGEDIIYIQSVSAKNENVTFLWQSEKSISPRISFGSVKATDFNYQENQPVIIKDTVGYQISLQPLNNNREYATAWKPGGQLHNKSVIIAVGNSERGQSTNQAIDAIVHFSASPFSSVLNHHREWWHSYYKKSFISIPDGRLESYYWLQLYKLASATRPGNDMIDLMGPWFTSKTPWPAIWWNLNTQLTYSPLFMSNHVDLAFPLFDALNNNMQQLINNVPEEWRYDAAAIGRISSYDLHSPLITGDTRNVRFEPGNLTWVMFYYHQYFRYTQDTVTLINKIQPLLKRSVNYLVHLLYKDGDGVYHLPLSSSPEYTNAEDAHYSLSSLRWGLQTLLQTSEITKGSDEEKSHWKEVLDHLAPLPVNGDGFMIGKNVELTSSHRHFSHLMAIWPYELVSPEKDDERKLIETSLNHWISREGALRGYSFTAASSISSLLGKGDDAYNYLDKFLNEHGEANGLYKESGPCFETPMASATSLLEMLLQSRDKNIHVFPAIPASWADVSFENLLADGAFQVSAVRKSNRTSFIRIKSIRGGSCNIISDIAYTSINIKAKNKSSVNNILQKENKTVVEITMHPGDEIIISDKSYKGNYQVEPVAVKRYSSNYWGLKKKRS